MFCTECQAIVEAAFTECNLTQLVAESQQGKNNVCLTKISLQ